MRKRIRCTKTHLLKIIIHYFFKIYLRNYNYKMIYKNNFKLYMIIKILFEKIIRIYQRDIFHCY